MNKVIILIREKWSRLDSAALTLVRSCSSPKINTRLDTWVSEFILCFQMQTIAKYVHGSMLSKRCVILPTVNWRPFASEILFWAILKEFEIY